MVRVKITVTTVTIDCNIHPISSKCAINHHWNYPYKKIKIYISFFFPRSVFPITKIQIDLSCLISIYYSLSVYNYTWGNLKHYNHSTLVQKYTTLQAVRENYWCTISINCSEELYQHGWKHLRLGILDHINVLPLKRFPFTCAMDVLPLKLKTKHGKGYDVYIE